MHQTYVTIAGNLTADPQSFQTDSGAYVRFSVASTPRVKDQSTGEYRDGTTTFYRVTAWRKLAENVIGSLAKGQPVIVTGRLTIDSYTSTEGEMRYSVALAADAIGHDLNFGRTQYFKPERVSAQPAAEEQAVA